MREGQGSELLQVETRLRPHELEFVAAAQDPVGPRFRADAHPVDAGRRQHGAVGFHGDLEAGLVQRCQQFPVDLQQGLAAGEHREAVRPVGRRPVARDPLCQVCGVLKLATVAAIRSDEIGVAELADSLRPVSFTARPQVPLSQKPSPSR